MSRAIAIRLLIVSLVLGAAALVSLAWVRAAAALPLGPTLVVSTRVPVLTPRVLLATPQQSIVVHNNTPRVLALTTTPHTTAAVHLIVPPHTTARLTLTTPGLYHLYDAATAYVSAYQAGTDVVRARPGTADPDLPDQGWIVVQGAADLPLDAHITIPAGNDLFMPRVVVVQLGGTVTIHNHDSDPHNLVTDPADPSGVAFELFGTTDEPAISGATRRLTFSEPGLYHLYCTMHTRVVGHIGSWQVVVPRDKMASGYREHNPMETWVLVVQEHVP